MLLRPLSEEGSDLLFYALIISASMEGGTILFSGFTRLCKGLAAVLVIVYVISQLVPPTIDYLALIPGKTVPFAWNLLTAGYLEQSIFGLILNIAGLLFSGKLLEPVWGSREFLKFIVAVNFSTSVSIFITAILLFYVTGRDDFLYTPLSGFHGVLSGFLVGVKQIMPEQEITAFHVFKLQAKWLPSLMVMVSIVVSLLTTESMLYLPFVIFGTYWSWLYLRYFQRNPETNLKGHLSDDFAFSTFFPAFLRTIIDAFASICQKLFCGNSQSSSDEQDSYVSGGISLPASNTIEASRRRQRGARALEERLGTTKDEEDAIVGDQSHEDASDIV